jgi:hypothetical protein
MVKSGTRLRSRVCSTEVIVVRPGPDDVRLTCGGHALVELGQEPIGLRPVDGLADGNQLGKRYTDGTGTLEVLVTKPGTGTLGNGSTPLAVKSAKPLPASD